MWRLGHYLRISHRRRSYPDWLASPDLGVVSVTLASSLIYALLVKHEDEASSFLVSVPTYTAVGAQAAVEQLATNAIVQQLAKDLI